jgi:prepilin-type N-terminal cleavage/methylation domain-containing protein
MFQGAIARNNGFSLIELLIAVAVLLVVSAAALSGLAAYGRSYSGTTLRQNMQSSMRSATELMEQEIGQAGLLSGLPGVSPIWVTAPASVNANAAAQAVTLNTTANLFPGEKLLVDLGANQEVVAIQTISGNNITGIFTNPHSSLAPVSVVGVFPQGVMSTSTATQLQLIGDINSDGSLYYVAYTCDTVAGTLTRSITQLPGTVANAPDVLVSNLVANPNGTPCFTYSTPAVVNGYTFITTVGVTLSTQSARPDPQTKQYVQMTKTFLNLNPRNVLFGLGLANASLTTPSLTDRLQPLPPQGTYRP